MKVLGITQVLGGFKGTGHMELTKEWLRKLSHYVWFAYKIRYIIMCPVFERMQDSVSILNSLDP